MLSSAAAFLNTIFRQSGPFVWELKITTRVCPYKKAPQICLVLCTPSSICFLLKFTKIGLYVRSKFYGKKWPTVSQNFKRLEWRKLTVTKLNRWKVRWFEWKVFECMWAVWTWLRISIWSRPETISHLANKSLSIIA